MARTARNLAAIALGALCLAGPASAADAPKRYLFLTPAEVDPARLLPPPPAEGSAAAKAELDELYALAARTTPAERAAASSDDKTKDASIFAAAIGPAFDLKALPATAKLMGEVRNEEKLAADGAKDHFLRKRPWIVDPKVQACATDDAPLSSYPSGHTTMGYSMAVVLAQLVPAKATGIMARAGDYGNSRLVCQMHFPADVAAGQALGAAVGVALLHNPGFQADLAAAQAELRAAGLTP